MIKYTLMFAGCSALIAVVLGAFGAHGLRNRVEPTQLHAWETAVNYQFVHALAMLALGLVIAQFGRSTLFLYSSIAFAAGTILFSGSLYLLVTVGLRWLGPVTPVGGLCFIVGWGLFIAGVAQMEFDR